MDKANNSGMQALSLKAGLRLFGTIHRVAGNRMAQIRHMDPNLMGTPRFQL